MFALLVLAMLRLCTASPTVESIATRKHFASEDSNRAAPHFDLTPWGYTSGQLPKVYDIQTVNMTYLPERSYAVYLDIVAGNKNKTDGPPLLDTSGVEERHLDKRCNTIHFDVTGPNNCLGTVQGQCVSPVQCLTKNCVWDTVTVYAAQNAYMTFWTSNACNGGKGSFNPLCDDYFTQNCHLKAQYQSVRVYDGCHSQYSSDGCY